MKNNRKFLMVILTVVLVILTACGNSSDKSNAEPNNQSSNNDENKTEHSLEDTDKSELNDQRDISSTNTNDGESLKTNNTGTTESKKEEYIEKLNDTKKEMDELLSNSNDTATYAMKKVEGDRYDAWDELLNEVYGVLKEQLAKEEMDQLREEQRNWIKYRDDTALEASKKYKGGTAEHLEYVTVLANLTEERCYELVESYM
ncbi:lysozyme inhibitor LprI family protein [Lederbergia wuyishanensis]|uniref:Uncharacterized protein YecT (DUF1311 family)/predicted small lipoprotein YifL n=1 Tax=Lederbergia wuyishanensis TaxID=1347903 RepID=A0ABU0D2N5_9BACI|nr:lysozyme inhibitor LprI family protein [Lederbergia wuyishanensis]MCJ8007194.1 DUF1311 domain-containing protein [Lederbergia wuyishanensis]MDQ0342661.1 uncharacterized protein YecT (DUF1311 family)/predicted small lipoprotein YifL [Lederbergia wuyishanensis]